MTHDTGPRWAAFTLVCAMFLTGCGAAGDGDGGAGASNDVTVSGTARAPSGAVAVFEQRPALLASLDFLLSPAAAAITGLQPVTGATVDLIRVDSAGNQVGAVLATTATSLTGDYTLVVPAGVSLAGNLIVRISGNGGAQMRAQVVENSVDITPVSEFVLRKFIDGGADLASLQTASVVRLTGQVEEFDLSAGADLAGMLAALEQETGDFVDSQLAVIAATPGNAATVVGRYRTIFKDWGLHDDDQQYGVGTLSSDLELATITLSDNGGGELAFSVGGAETAYTNQMAISGSTQLSFIVEVETETDTGTAQLDDAGVLSVQTEFEEEISGDFGWRFPPSLVRLQKAMNANLFIGTEADAGVRYLTVDTNNDGLKDAVDPAQREGDEVFRGFSIVAQAPDGASAADLDGDFGRVFFATTFNENGAVEIESESNVLSFVGTGAVIDMAEAQNRNLSRTAYTTSTSAAEAGVPYTLAADGDLETIGGEAVDGFVNADFDFLAIAEADSIDDAEPGDERVEQASFETTLAVKLPAATLDLSNRQYRVIFVGVGVQGAGTSIVGTRFDSTFTVNNDGTSGSLVARTAEIAKSTLTAEVVSNNDAVPVTTAATLTLAGNGASTITITDSDGTATLQGYFSHDGTLGIFETRSVDAQDTNPNELGVAILVQI